MQKPTWVAGGIAMAMFGTLFFFQGIGVVQGSFMSDTTFWTIAGPIIAVTGLALAAVGARRRAH